METAHGLEALELEGVVGHGGQVDVEELAPLLLAHPVLPLVVLVAAHHPVAQSVEHALVGH